MGTNTGWTNGRRRQRFGAVVTVVLALVAASCASGSDLEPSTQAPVEATTSTTAPTPAPTSLPEPVDTESYLELAAQLPTAADDSSIPDLEPTTAFGGQGFSRYVYDEREGLIYPSLVEGPRGQQYRCQDLELPCSFGELEELYASGADVPSELGMNRKEVGELVTQLQETSDFIAGYPSMDAACAANMRPTSNQAANMGIHMMVPRNWGKAFDPARPQQVLFAREGGAGVPWPDQGECVDGEWTGESGYVPVGAVFLQKVEPDHPDGFTGPIDNWHIHYNLCQGTKAGFFAGDPDGCEENGGRYTEKGAVWMIHAYVAPDFQADTGVFAMWNNNVWPISDPAALLDRKMNTPEGTQSIENFDFGSIVGKAGEDIPFINADNVPHTITSIDGSFDTGVFGTGETSSLRFDEPGQYAMYCSLHPNMVGTITVEPGDDS